MLVKRSESHKPQIFGFHTYRRLVGSNWYYNWHQIDIASLPDDQRRVSDKLYGNRTKSPEVMLAK